MLKKFERNDVFINTIKAYPKCKFFLYKKEKFFNNDPIFTGSQSNIKIIHPGEVSLDEMNIDRAPDNLIYPFVVKDSSLNSFSTVSSTDFNTDLYGTVITGSYPLTATMSVKQYYGSTDPSLYTGEHVTRPQIWSLKNALKSYYTYSSNYYWDADTNNKETDAITLVDIPSIFYGSEIRKGSISLKFYITGTLAAEIQDYKQNGCLIQTYPERSELTFIDNCAGVVLYREGIILLYGTWSLNSAFTEQYRDGAADQPRWIYWGTNINEVTGSSFLINFEGTTYIPHLTMLAKAERGELNHSNNPTYVGYDQTDYFNSGTYIYAENDTREIFNTAKSIYPNFSESFKKQTWISKVVIYDENKSPIAVAKLATPVKKVENRDIIIKLKLDI
ncbi:hypothetical protein M0R19_04335 [Candidatus Pacearchaeota archaeon]|nr:hypothetical protein [Candidatus Pacearchaeota archaeon]